MNDDLRRVPETIRLSKKTYAVLWQNISLALGIKAVFFVLAVFGSATSGWQCSRTWVRACWSSTACGCCAPAATADPGIPSIYTFLMRRCVAFFACIAVAAPGIPGLQLPTIASMRKSHNSKVRILATMRIRMLRPRLRTNSAKSLFLLPTFCHQPDAAPAIATLALQIRR